MSARVVLLTGANSGVGYATAEVLAAAPENFHVIMTGRSLQKVQAAKAEIESADPTTKSHLTALQLDVTDASSIRAAADQVSQQFGRIDALINNAALGDTHEQDLKARFQSKMDTNVIGPAVVTDIFRPLLLKAPDKPYSIFVSSGAGSFARALSRVKPPAPANPNAYMVSKAALNMLALQEHIDFGSKMKVFAMNPGFVVSNLRGTTEEERSGWGQAGDARVAGETMLSILRGERDADIGKLVTKDGVYDW